MKTTFHITDMATGKFWSGRKWVYEYPNAKEYRSQAAADRDAATIALKEPCQVWTNYGSLIQRHAQFPKARGEG